MERNMSAPPLKDRSIRKHNSWELKQEPKKAAKEVLVASRKPNPPIEHSKVACSQAMSDIEDLQI